MSALNTVQAPTLKHSSARKRLACRAPLRALLISAALLSLPFAPFVRTALAQEPSNTADNAGASKKTADAAEPKPPGGTEGEMPRGVNGSIKGRVISENGEPLGGVSIYAMGKRNAGPPFRPPQSATSDEEGAFILQDLEPTIYNLNANLSGYVLEPDTMPVPSRSRVRLGDNVVIKMMKGGVVTGTVTDAAGVPLVGMSVRLVKVRDLEGSAFNAFLSFGTREGTTDDRGIYRVYGLEPGVYVVSSGGSPMYAWWPVPHAESAPTFYPSGTRDSAAEISVRGGQETTGIDIRFRDERGHRISGTVVLPPSQPGENAGSLGINLVHAASGTFLAAAWSSGSENDRSFYFEGIADGEYDLTVQHNARGGVMSNSPPLRVSVKGADVTGLKLTPIPSASLSGTLVIEPLPEAARAGGKCTEQKSRMLPQETGIYARLEHLPAPKKQPRPRSFGNETTPDQSGAFSARNLLPGRYRIEVRPADENFYARSIQLPESATGAAATTPAPAASKPGAARAATPNAAVVSKASGDALDLRSGQQVSGVSIRVAEGAAFVAGRVVSAEEGAALPTQVRLYLLPAEREQADNTLRFYESIASGDGSFLFRNLAPGRYLLVARAVQIDPTDPTTMRPAFWDAAERAKMRREAEAANLSLDLQPCQRVADLTLRYPQAANK
jgi:hypothetical protein